jgi:hypothetical protein
MAIKKKSELRTLTQDFINNRSPSEDVSPYIQQFFQTFLSLLRKENPSLLKEFLIAFQPLLKSRKIPFLDLHTFLLLYKRWKIHPTIIKEVVFFGKHIHRIHSQDCWFLVIQHSGTNKEGLSIQQNRLILLACMFNLDVLDERDVTDHPSLIRSILSLCVNQDNISLLQNNLIGEDDHPYHVMFLHLTMMKERGVHSLEMSEIVLRHFSPPNPDFRLTYEMKDFVLTLYAALPPNFLFDLSCWNFNKLYILYSQNSELFLNWKPEVTNPLSIHRLMSSLFNTFVVSGVFIHSYANDTLSDKERSWFMHVLHKKKITQAEGLPIPLTKKAAHIFRCMKEGNLSVTAAIILSALAAEVGDMEYARQVVQTMRDYRKAEFWVQTMSILHRNGLNSHHVTETMDYIDHKVFVEGQNLHLKHKKLTNLLNEIRVWHEELSLNAVKPFGNRKLPFAGIDNYQLEYLGQQYEIIQIRRVIDLYHEGKSLQHCVYTYRLRCMQRKCFIFSLRQVVTEESKEPLITIELCGDQIVQARGKYNRSPKDAEKEIIRLWGQDNELCYAV